jgi:hypothetical protein
MPDTTPLLGSMDEPELARAIGAQTSSRSAHRGRRCPSAEQVAGYLELRLTPEGKARFEAHLAQCDFCIGFIGALARQEEAKEQVAVPAHLVREAIEAVPQKTSAGWSWRWVLAPALASIVVVSAVLLKPPKPPQFAVPHASSPTVEKITPPPAVPQSQSRPAKAPEVRSLRPPASGPQLLEPRSGSVLPAAGLRFRWKAVADAAYYEVRVVNSEGDPVWGAESREAIAQTPADLSLRTGKYFVWVQAHLRDGRTLKSDTIGFRIVNSS